MSHILDKNIHSLLVIIELNLKRSLDIQKILWMFELLKFEIVFDEIVFDKTIVLSWGSTGWRIFFVWDWWNNQYLWHLGLLLNQEGSTKGKLSASGKLRPIKQTIYCFLLHKHSHRELFSRCLFGILQGLWNWKHLTLFMGPHPIWVWYEQ